MNIRNYEIKNNLIRAYKIVDRDIISINGKTFEFNDKDLLFYQMVIHETTEIEDGLELLTRWFIPTGIILSIEQMNKLYGEIV